MFQRGTPQTTPFALKFGGVQLEKYTKQKEAIGWVYDPPREAGHAETRKSAITCVKFLDFCLKTLAGPFSAVKMNSAEIYFVVSRLIPIRSFPGSFVIFVGLDWDLDNRLDWIAR